ncbi:MAG: DUF1629 domain-containing protein [Lysobacterales bacterium]
MNWITLFRVIDGTGALRSDQFLQTYRSEPPEDSRKKPRFSDCMQILSSAAPAYSCTSFNTLVSEKAKTALSSVTQNEIAFLPVTVIGAPTQYYAMWVRRVLDAVDNETSDLGPDRFGEPGRYRLGANCHYRDVDAEFAFRLPAWKYDGDSDLVTERFVDVVLNAKLTGFTFRLGGPFGKVLSQ